MSLIPRSLMPEYDRNSLGPSIVSFIAGAATAIAVVYFRSPRTSPDSEQANPPALDSDENSEPPKDEPHTPQATPSCGPQTIRSSSTGLRRSFTDFVGDILGSATQFQDTDNPSISPDKPRRKIPWPWMDLHKRKRGNSLSGPSTPDRSSGNAAKSTTIKTRSDSLSSDKTASPSTRQNGSGLTKNPSFSEDEKKADLCIGSIFGLDVGGTLAKLVYFEEQPLYRHTHGHMTRTMRRSTANLKGEPLHKTSSDRDVTIHPDHPRASARSKPTNLELAARFSSYDDAEPLANQLLEGNGNDVEASISADKVRRTQSMLDFLTQREHRAQALDRFYAFARDNLHNSSGAKEGSSDPEASEKRSSSGAMQNEDDRETSNDPAAPSDGTDDMIRDDNLSFDSLDGTFHFLHFETRKMDQAIDLIRRYELHQTIHSLGATGGGAHKFASVFQDELGISMKKVDELESLVAGMQFVLQTVVGECYTYRPPQGHKTGGTVVKRVSSSSLNNHYGNYVGVEEETWPVSNTKRGDVSGNQSENVTEATPSDSTQDDTASSSAAPKPGNQLDEWWWSRKVPRDAISDAATYPYLLVTIGTGVSILRVDGPRKHERISGSTIGGGTYWGLIRLLTSVDNFSSVIQLAEKGDPSKVDMMVGDIYGSNPEALDKLGLREDLVASSFGKLVAKEDPAEGLKEEDLARALLLMVTNNIGQVAYLNAQLHKTTRIYFVGNFLRANMLSQRRLSFAIDYWSKGKMEALFLEHEGYFGALGAFLLSQGISSNPSQLHSRDQSRHSAHVLTPQHSMPIYSDDEVDPDDDHVSHLPSKLYSGTATTAFHRRSMTSIDG